MKQQPLAQGEYLAGDYSIADIAAYPWINVSEWTTLNIEDYKNLARWYKKISLRPAVKLGMSLPTGITLE
jgi:GST-like protein